jgi:hypothetical protein
MKKWLHENALWVLLEWKTLGKLPSSMSVNISLPSYTNHCHQPRLLDHSDFKNCSNNINSNE